VCWHPLAFFFVYMYLAPVLVLQSMSNSNLTVERSCSFQLADRNCLSMSAIEEKTIETDEKPVVITIPSYGRIILPTLYNIARQIYYIHHQS
jgi:hypothetical protein